MYKIKKKMFLVFIVIILFSVLGIYAQQSMTDPQLATATIKSATDSSMTTSSSKTLASSTPASTTDTMTAISSPVPMTDDVMIPGMDTTYNKITCKLDVFWHNQTTKDNFRTGEGVKVFAGSGNEVKAYAVCLRVFGGIVNGKLTSGDIVPDGTKITFNIFEDDLLKDDKVRQEVVNTVGGTAVLTLALDFIGDGVGDNTNEFYFKVSGSNVYPPGESGTKSDELLYVKEPIPCSKDSDCPSGEMCDTSKMQCMPILPTKTPAPTTTADTDGDGIPDSTDTDDDNDGIPDASDPEPTTIETCIDQIEFSTTVLNAATNEPITNAEVMISAIPPSGIGAEVISDSGYTDQNGNIEFSFIPQGDNSANIQYVFNAYITGNVLDSVTGVSSTTLQEENTIILYNVKCGDILTPDPLMASYLEEPVSAPGGSSQLGERCTQDSDCASGYCNSIICLIGTIPCHDHEGLNELRLGDTNDDVMHLENELYYLTYYGEGLLTSIDNVFDASTEESVRGFQCDYMTSPEDCLSSLVTGVVDEVTWDTIGQAVCDRLGAIYPPTEPLTGEDFDNDGMPDVIDPDDDNDGIADGNDASDFDIIAPQDAVTGGEPTTGGIDSGISDTGGSGGSGDGGTGGSEAGCLICEPPQTCAENSFDYTSSLSYCCQTQCELELYSPAAQASLKTIYKCEDIDSDGLVERKYKVCSGESEDFDLCTKVSDSQAQDIGYEQAEGIDGYCSVREEATPVPTYGLFSLVLSLGILIIFYTKRKFTFR